MDQRSFAITTSTSAGVCVAGDLMDSNRDKILEHDNMDMTENTERLRIRYLTPRECLRLQAFPDDAIDKLEAVLPKSALYKVAGNSIAVCCLKAIFKGIYINKTFKKDKQSRIESFF